MSNEWIVHIIKISKFTRCAMKLFRPNQTPISAKVEWEYLNEAASYAAKGQINESLDHIEIAFKAGCKNWDMLFFDEVFEDVLKTGRFRMMVETYRHCSPEMALVLIGKVHRAILYEHILKKINAEDEKSRDTVDEIVENVLSSIWNKRSQLTADNMPEMILAEADSEILKYENAYGHSLNMTRQKKKFNH